MAQIKTYTPQKPSGLGEWIKGHRTAMGLSLRNFAELAGIAHSTLDSVEKEGTARDGTLDLIVKAIAESGVAGKPFEELQNEAKAARAGIESPAVDDIDMVILKRIQRLNDTDKEYVESLIDRLVQGSQP